MDNNELILSLINNIEDGNMSDAEQDYDLALSAKVGDILASRRQEMTNRIFNGEVEQDESEEV
jgi:hypothetical protein